MAQTGREYNTGSPAPSARDTKAGVGDDQGPRHGDLLVEAEAETETREYPVRRLLLIRHGHYDRVDNLGDTVWGLSPLGRRQAARTGHRLSRLIPHFGGKLDGVYSSPWPRAMQTAEIAAHEFGLERVRVKPYLHESVPLVPLAADGVSSAHPTLPPTTAVDRSEVTEQVRRVVARFFKASKRPSTYVLFIHGNLIRYLLAHSLGLPFESWMHIAIYHASITELRVFPGGMTALISFNETGHLPPEMITA
ncbi:histidine phosphatase family protein [Pseudenhygromyxa sp. WMMC2535]|uniref:histidine phosphatase family protein n=1 Tax=Pseudenhygromyxa sp. WMMC2535 TaxID=2712867 RepID=UPI001596229C|nr:histidine phosphatase family protein [Pseudenhygromyxa sp. WMMC2535]NVB40884.1 histidine phosphatase family protein [Pseudenhygromyxa sp. WMMC2535]